MEVSISGALHPKQMGYRATINSYQFGDANPRQSRFLAAHGIRESEAIARTRFKLTPTLRIIANGINDQAREWMR